MDISENVERIPVGRVFESVPLTSKHWKYLVILFFAFVIEAWELLIIAYVGGAIASDFHFKAAQLGTLISAIFFGMIPGALIWGPVSDRIGRKKVVIWSLALYGVIALISAMSVSYAMLFVMRFLAGVAMAGAFTIGFPYLEELVPVKSRGRFTVYLASGWPIGTLIAVGITLWLLPLGWRWVIGVSALAGLWSLVAARYLPESPYWLAGNGRSDEAREVIQKISNDATRVDQDLYVEEHKSGSIAEVFGKRLWKVTVAQIILNFTFSWGYWGLQTWLPTLLQERGFGVTQSLTFVAIFAVFMIPGYISAAFLTQKYGRKWVFFSYIILAAAGGYFFGRASTLSELYIGAFVLAFFAQGGWGIWDTWVGELYPSKIRASGYSWGIIGQRIANAVAPVVVGFLVARATSFTATVLFINAFLLATALISLYFAETEGKELA
jgi:putative MFS transporter